MPRIQAKSSDTKGQPQKTVENLTSGWNLFPVTEDGVIDYDNEGEATEITREVNHSLLPDLL